MHVCLLILVPSELAPNHNNESPSRIGYRTAENFRWTKICPAPYPCITEIFHRIKFHPCGEDHHRHYVIINIGQKIHSIKISPMRAGGEKRKFPTIRYKILAVVYSQLGVYSSHHTNTWQHSFELVKHFVVHIGGKTEMLNLYACSLSIFLSLAQKEV